MEPIDFVILWVDCNDPAWQEKKKQYQPGQGSDTSVARYRDWDNLLYWFRGVAKYAPWVRKVHLVTDGQIPPWINLECPKLNLVHHKDYMPVDALPVFNSSAIEVGIHRIEGLANQFVYFNDDMFLTAEIDSEYYFRNQLPVDMAGLTRSVTPEPGNTFSCLMHNNYSVISNYFKKKCVIEENIVKWLRPAYGKTFIRTVRYLFQSGLRGLVIPHLSVSYVKSDFEKVWEIAEEDLNKTQYHRFRDNRDLTYFLFRFWRMCEGKFYPRKSLGKYYSAESLKDIEIIAKAIRNQRYPEICINDCWKDDDFEQAKLIINDAFETVLGEKCEFEK